MAGLKCPARKTFHIHIHRWFLSALYFMAIQKAQLKLYIIIAILYFIVESQTNYYMQHSLLSVFKSGRKNTNKQIKLTAWKFAEINIFFMFSFNVVSLWVLPGYPGPCPVRFFLRFAFLHSQNRYLLSFVHLAPSFSYISWRWGWLFDFGRHMRIYVEATSARVTISNKSPVRTLIVNVQMNDWKRKIGELDFWPFLEAGMGRTIRFEWLYFHFVHRARDLA